MTPTSVRRGQRPPWGQINTTQRQPQAPANNNFMCPLHQLHPLLCPPKDQIFFKSIREQWDADAAKGADVGGVDVEDVGVGEEQVSNPTHPWTIPKQADSSRPPQEGGRRTLINSTTSRRQGRGARGRGA